MRNVTGRCVKGIKGIVGRPATRAHRSKNSKVTKIQLKGGSVPVTVNECCSLCCCCYDGCAVVVVLQHFGFTLSSLVDVLVKCGGIHRTSLSSSAL